MSSFAPASRGGACSRRPRQCFPASALTCRCASLGEKGPRRLGSAAPRQDAVAGTAAPTARPRGHDVPEGLRPRTLAKLRRRFRSSRCRPSPRPHVDYRPIRRRRSTPKSLLVARCSPCSSTPRHPRARTAQLINKPWPSLSPIRRLEQPCPIARISIARHRFTASKPDSPPLCSIC
jgi:hypothetical protein